MVQFSVPLKTAPQGKAKPSFTFSITDNAVLFAGSRNLSVPFSVCSTLINGFARLGRGGFFVGCAKGVDESFRFALSLSPHAREAFVACAFENRVKKNYGLYSVNVVPPEVPPKGALVRRTLWLVKNCSMAVIFPDNPQTGTWGKGSRLAFNSCIYQLKPVFIVSETPPPEAEYYRILPSDLFATVSGWWVVPHTCIEDGLCDDC
jgi:hypothetical protein